MMQPQELVARVKGYDPGVDAALLERAYDYARKAHAHQKRASGQPFFSHPLEVAAILTEMRLDEATIASALLHDTIEDTSATRDEIDRLFGEEIGHLVEGLTKLKRLDLVSKKAEQAENFRKLLLAISSDIRVLLVKLADRLHNMRTLEHMRPAKRRLVAEETLEIYAPLAGRMGIQWLRDELEDLSFRWLEPEAHRTITHRLEELRRENRGLIDEILAALEAKLEQNDIKAKVTGREKKPYSIWRKMENKQISLEQLSDIYGFRIIVENVDDCYRALGVVHTTWRMVPGRFKDYVSNPKQNDYQSIHTTIVGPRHQRVELQIRTQRMHEVAELGVAAHALYKDGVNGGGNGAADHAETNAYQWLRRLVETLLEGDNPEEFLEHTKLELFHDQVFCFTPKGRLIALPTGATPIDFAYAVHTDVGHSCVGAKINGRHMPLVTRLMNGDEVEIITSDAQTPPAAWEKIAITGKARSAIRRATREARLKQYCELGRRILSAAFERIGKSYEDKLLARGLHRLPQKSEDEVLAAVGRGELASDDVVRAVFPDIEPRRPDAARRALRNRRQEASASKPGRRKRSGTQARTGRREEGWFSLKKVMNLKFRIPGKSAGQQDDARRGIPIRGHRGDVPVEFAEGGAVPGDRIVGSLTRGSGIRIYHIHSPELERYDDQPERWLDVTWDVDESRAERFPAKIVVTALNEPGTLAQIAKVIGEADGNIDNLRMLHRAADFTEMLIELEVWDLKHLNEIVTGLKARPAVSRVERVFR